MRSDVKRSPPTKGRAVARMSDRPVLTSVDGAASTRELVSN